MELIPPLLPTPWLLWPSDCVICGDQLTMNSEAHLVQEESVYSPKVYPRVSKKKNTEISTPIWKFLKPIFISLVWCPDKIKE
jgi:hypothetical protein